MKKVSLSEQDLNRIVKRVIKENMKPVHKKIVIDVLTQKVKDLIEDFSSPESIFMVQDKIYNKMGEETSYEDVKDLVEELTIPLMIKFGMGTKNK